MLFLVLWAFLTIGTPKAQAYWNSYTYGGYSGYFPFGGQQNNSIISLDMNPHHITDSSFRIAAREDRLKDMLRLLRHGANVNSASDEGTTALMYASRNCSPRIVHELLIHGAMVNLRDHEGDTALIYATLESCLPVVKLLLQVPRIDVRFRDRSNRTVFDYARDCAEVDVDGPANKILELLNLKVPRFHFPVKTAKRRSGARSIRRIHRAPRRKLQHPPEPTGAGVDPELRS